MEANKYFLLLIIIYIIIIQPTIKVSYPVGYVWNRRVIQIISGEVDGSLLSLKTEESDVIHPSSSKKKAPGGIYLLFPWNYMPCRNRMYNGPGPLMPAHSQVP